MTPRCVLNTLLACLCSVVFLLASQYCALEAFAEHHDEHAPAAPGHHDEAGQCCAAMQAVVVSRANIHIASSPAWPLHPLALESVWLVSIFEPSHAATGLSPPTQASPQARPFYRTTFASHAPPVYLA